MCEFTFVPFVELSSMSCDVARRPDQVTASFAYHYCKIFMSHFGIFSWEQRCVVLLVCVVCVVYCSVSVVILELYIHLFLSRFSFRPQLDLLEKTDQLIRELKHLDARNTQW